MNRDFFTVINMDIPCVRDVDEVQKERVLAQQKRQSDKDQAIRIQAHEIAQSIKSAPSQQCTYTGQQLFWEVHSELLRVGYTAYSLMSNPPQCSWTIAWPKTPDIVHKSAL